MKIPIILKILSYNANLTNANFSQAKFDSCNFENVKFIGTDLGMTIFEKCNLTGATLKNNKYYFDGMSFNDVNLTDATLNGNFKFKEFNKVNLKNSNLSGADLEGKIYDNMYYPIPTSKPFQIKEFNDDDLHPSVFVNTTKYQSAPGRSASGRGAASAAVPVNSAAGAAAGAAAAVATTVASAVQKLPQ